MAGNDDLIARLLSKKYTREAWDEPHGAYDQPCDADDYGAEESFVNPAGPDAAREIERLRTALAERDATIERLKAGKEAAATEIVRLVKERDEAHANHQWAQARLEHSEARAETAERERDEARAEVERLKLRLRDAFNLGHSMGELLPCPFCGASDVLLDDAPAFATIYCENCGAEGAPSLDPNEAAAAWNRRSDHAGLISGLKEAEKIAYRAAMRFDTHSAVLAIRARIAALETEEGK